MRVLILAILVGYVLSDGDPKYVDCLGKPYLFDGWMRNMFFYTRGSDIRIVNTMVELEIPWISRTINDSKTFDMVGPEDAWNICHRTTLIINGVTLLAQMFWISLFLGFAAECLMRLACGLFTVEQLAAAVQYDRMR